MADKLLRYQGMLWIDGEQPSAVPGRAALLYSADGTNRGATKRRTTLVFIGISCPEDG
ncbi:GTP-binding protein [Salmonella enterica subsp. enterica]|nr:GTP-binding protein [Salmonella enterica subsp. enterica]